mmetsp:Transcript_61222/g.124832  ORF Transcript_61222/g.124832 Transcript_61222/m.124832 type:complete len:240 (-) Transcript_61222:539-1258(-)
MQSHCISLLAGHTARHRHAASPLHRLPPPVRVEGLAKRPAAGVQALEELCRRLGSLQGLLRLSAERGEGAQDIGAWNFPRYPGIHQKDGAVLILDPLQVSHTVVAAGDPRDVVEEGMRKLEKFLAAIKDELRHILPTVGQQCDDVTGRENLRHWRLHYPAAKRSADSNIRHGLRGAAVQEASTPAVGLENVEVELVGVVGNRLPLLDVQSGILCGALLSRGCHLQQAPLPLADIEAFLR